MGGVITAFIWTLSLPGTVDLFLAAPSPLLGGACVMIDTNIGYNVNSFSEHSSA